MGTKLCDKCGWTYEQHGTEPHKCRKTCNGCESHVCVDEAYAKYRLCRATGKYIKFSDTGRPEWCPKEVKS